jgi:AcrR family transcriptional regulator
MEIRDNQTRQGILKAALKQFAECGYPGASVQKIVDEAKVTKPTLYYYFKSKAGLYQALLDWAYNERYRLMQEAIEGTKTLAEQLEAILTSMFEFLKENRGLMRIAFATAFAAPGELPPNLNYLEKGQRNFDLVFALIKEAQARGEVTQEFSTDELTRGIYGMFNLYVMGYIVDPRMQLDDERAERIVELFLRGAGVRGEGSGGHGARSRETGVRRQRAGVRMK